MKYLLDVNVLLAACHTGHLAELARAHEAQLATMDTGIPAALLLPA
jgi:hypothetical protein